MKITWLLALLAFPFGLAAQNDTSASTSAAAPCSAAEYRQFDFWIGEWTVTSGEQLAGTNSIQPVHGGCALNENWQGAGQGGVSGSSFNIYDRATGHWHQTWVDGNGTLLLLDGGLVDGNMVLKGTRPARDGNGVTLHRITWTPNEDGTVRQLWEASRDDGGSWSVLFDGLYTKESATP